MSWFKTILLLGVLAMTWAERDRRPAAQTHGWPEAAFEPGTTNALRVPGPGDDSSARIVSVDLIPWSGAPRAWRP